MKKLLQVAVLYLPGADALLIMVTICSVIMLFKLMINNFLSNRRRWKMRKKVREIESNVWEIE